MESAAGSTSSLLSSVRPFSQNDHSQKNWERAHMAESSTTTERPIEVGVFDSIDAAGRAVDNLLQAGFTKDQITVVCSDETKERYFRQFEHQKPAGTYDVKAMVTGSALGALLAGVTVIVSAVATGGLAILAAGPLTAAAGGVAGGFIGAMMTRGVEREVADFYQQAVVEGRILVAAEATGDNAPKRLARRPHASCSKRAPIPCRSINNSQSPQP
jgi:hypothetical protein